MPKTKQTYEQMIKRLEEIACRLAEGDLTLDEMIKLYEEGEALITKSRDTINAYQARLDLIEKQSAGEQNE